MEGRILELKSAEGEALEKAVRDSDVTRQASVQLPLQREVEQHFGELVPCDFAYYREQGEIALQTETFVTGQGLKYFLVFSFGKEEDDDTTPYICTDFWRKAIYGYAGVTSIGKTLKTEQEIKSWKREMQRALPDIEKQYLEELERAREHGYNV